MLCRLRSFSYDSKQNCEVQIHFVEQNSRDLRVFWKKKSSYVLVIQMLLATGFCWSFLLMLLERDVTKDLICGNQCSHSFLKS